MPKINDKYHSVADVRSRIHDVRTRRRLPPNFKVVPAPLDSYADMDS